MQFTKNRKKDQEGKVAVDYYVTFRSDVSFSNSSINDILQPGNKLVAAGYCMYGSSTQLVLTYGNGVHGFTLDPQIGAFVLSHRDIRIPENPKRVSLHAEKFGVVAERIIARTDLLL